MPTRETTEGVLPVPRFPAPSGIPGVVIIPPV